MAEFPDEIIKAAQAADSKWDVAAAVTLAQWAEESDYGKAIPPGSNNPFGIKAAKGQPYVEVPTHEGSHGQIRTRARFRKFDTIADAFDKHGELLATSKAYRKAQATDTDEDYALALSGIYAEDLNYGKKLIAIMDAHDLYQYDVD